MATPFPQFEGKYEIITKLKEGGMGAVYKVRHRLLDEVRVIKLIRPQLESDEAIRARFLREARTAVRLRHPNIAQFYDFSMDDEGNAFLVMEFIEGITLEELLARIGPPPLPLALVIAVQSLQALGYLHRRSVIHRDISPDNLMLSRDDEGQPLVKLIDLGIAKVLEEEGHSQVNRRGLTGTGMFLGKVRYASPEQFHAQEGVTMDARSDLYSFGLVFYELLTGRHPVRGSSVPSFIAGHLFHPPVPFSESDPEGRIPGDLREVVLHALAKGADARIPSAEAFVRLLAPIRDRYPLSSEEAVVTLDGVTSVFTEKTQVGRSGSTQARLDRQFGIAPTPAPTPGSGPRPADATPPAGSTVSPVAPLPERPRSPEGDATPATAAERADDTRPIAFLQPEPESPPLPAVVSAGGQDTRVLVIPGAGVPRAAALVRAARELIEQGRWGEALERLSSALSLDPENPDVRTLHTQAEQAMAAEAERARRASALATHAKHVEEMLGAGQLDQARLGIESAMADVGRDEALDSLMERLVAAESAQAESLGRQAEAAIADGDPEAAVSAVQQAIALRPDDDALRALLRRAEAACERRHQLAAAVAEIESSLGRQDLPGSRLALDRALECFGGDPAIEGVRRRVESGERQALAREVSQLVSLARTHLNEGRLSEAREAAAKAYELQPASWEAAAALADIKATEEKLAAEARAAEEARLAAERAAEEERVAAQRRADAQRAEAAGRVREQITAGDLDTAGKALAEVRASLGEGPELVAVSHELDRARVLQREERTSALLLEARRLADERRFDEAEARLGEADVLSPRDGRVLQATVEVRAAARKHRDQQERARAVADEVAAIGTALDAGELGDAASRFDAAIRKLGDRPELAALRRRLHEARHAERERISAERKATRASRKAESLAIEDGQTLRIVRDGAVPPAGGAVGDETPGALDRDTEPLVVPSRESIAERAAPSSGVVEREVSSPGIPAESKAPLATPGSQKPLSPASPGLLEPAPSGEPAAPQEPVRKPPATRQRSKPAHPVAAGRVKPAPVIASVPPAEPAAPPAPAAQADRAPEAEEPRGRARWKWPLVGAFAAVVVAVIGVGILKSRPVPGLHPTPRTRSAPTAVVPTPRPVVTQGSLVIAAIPWAEVVSVSRESGGAIDLPAVRSTPMVLPLTAGRYVVSLRDPVSGAQRSQSVVVGATGVTRVVVEVRAVRAEDLLKRFGWSG